MSRMKFNYIFTKEDYSNFRFENNIYLYEGRKRITIYAFITILLYVLLSIYISNATGYILYEQLWWIIVTVFSIITVFYLRLTFKNSIQQLTNTQDKFVPEETELEILDDRIVERITNDNPYVLPFSDVQKLIKAKDYVGISKKKYTLVIPKNLFETEGDFQAFIIFITKKLPDHLTVVER